MLNVFNANFTLIGSFAFVTILVMCGALLGWVNGQYVALEELSEVLNNAVKERDEV